MLTKAARIAATVLLLSLIGQPFIAVAQMKSDTPSSMLDIRAGCEFVDVDGSRYSKSYILVMIPNLKSGKITYKLRYVGATDRIVNQQGQTLCDLFLCDKDEQDCRRLVPGTPDKVLEYTTSPTLLPREFDLSKPPPLPKDIVGGVGGSDILNCTLGGNCTEVVAAAAEKNPGAQLVYTIIPEGKERAVAEGFVALLSPAGGDLRNQKPPGELLPVSGVGGFGDVTGPSTDVLNASAPKKPPGVPWWAWPIVGVLSVEYVAFTFCKFYYVLISKKTPVLCELSNYSGK